MIKHVHIQRIHRCHRIWVHSPGSCGTQNCVQILVKGLASKSPKPSTGCPNKVSQSNPFHSMIWYQHMTSWLCQTSSICHVPFTKNIAEWFAGPLDALLAVAGPISMCAMSKLCLDHVEKPCLWRQILINPHVCWWLVCCQSTSTYASNSPIDPAIFQHSQCIWLWVKTHQNPPKPPKVSAKSLAFPHWYHMMIRHVIPSGKRLHNYG